MATFTDSCALNLIDARQKNIDTFSENCRCKNSKNKWETLRIADASSRLIDSFQKALRQLIVVFPLLNSGGDTTALNSLIFIMNTECAK